MKQWRTKVYRWFRIRLERNPWRKMELACDWLKRDLGECFAPAAREAAQAVERLDWLLDELGTDMFLVEDDA